MPGISWPSKPPDSINLANLPSPPHMGIIKHTTESLAEWKPASDPQSKNLLASVTTSALWLCCRAEQAYK